MSPADAKSWLQDASAAFRDTYARNRRALSFAEYLTLFVGDMRRQVRSAAQYVRDVFDYYGTTTVSGARGASTRWRLFDCPWADGQGALKGQEEVQAAVYRLICNFAREGRTNRLILLHGPNGSAKSTFVGCVQRAMEHYSTLDEGALYRFNWIFPSQQVSKAGIGFGGGAGAGVAEGGAGDSYALLDEASIESKIVDELRDHPILLLPRDARRRLLTEHLGAELEAGLRPAAALLDGDLSHRNRQIVEALLSSYRGDLAKVLRHVQVERFYISRRYRQAASTVEPQLAVDARARQLTTDRSLSALPAALQSLTLYEFQGELVDGNRGLIEYADLLKRPLDAFKYLLGTVEEGHVSLEVARLDVDTVFIASSNEGYLAAFKELPEFQSFKARIELVRAPYLLDHRVEQTIYEEHLRSIGGPRSDKHVAPHVPYVAALWAVLTRMKKPVVEKYPKGLGELVGRLSPLDKALLYAGEAPGDEFSAAEARELRAGVERIARESDSYPNYEGRTGVSPREMKLLLMNAGQSPRYQCLSPFALLDELEELVRNVSVYEFLKQEPLSGGWHENRRFIFVVRDRLIDRIDDEVRTAMGLVEERKYIDQFERYVTQVSYWVKKEKVPNPITGRDEDPDEDFMSEIENLLDGAPPGGDKREDLRRDVISKIGAWSVDHPGQKPDYEQIFARAIGLLRESFFAEHKRRIRKINQDLIVLLTDGPERLAPDGREPAARTLANLKQRFGYCDHCAKDAVLALVKKRYA